MVPIFLIVLFDSLQSNFLTSLYVLDISPLSDVSLVKIFSQIQPWGSQASVHLLSASICV
jgi:hypothetical protein